MSLDLSIAGVPLTTAPASLKAFKTDVDLAFHLDDKLSAFLDTALSLVAAAAAKTTVAYANPAACWNPAAGPVQFGLQGGASGSLEILTAGDLIAFSDGLDTPQQKSVPVPPNTACLRLTLHFNISANASFKYSGGSYGAKAALDTADIYAIAFTKPFPPDTPLGPAIAQTFESFVLPLHVQTLTQLSPGDHLHYEFDGNLHLAFGAYVGLDKILYAGQSSAGVLQCLKSPLATLAVQTKPELKLAANLDFVFAYATRFDAMLSMSAASATLRLFRSAKSTQSATLKSGLTFDDGNALSVTGHGDTLKTTILNAAGGPATTPGKALTTVLSTAQSEIDKYLTELSDKLTGWVNRANGLQANLQVCIEATEGRTLLAGYIFDLASPNLPAAWQAAFSGDLVKALSTGGITLDLGSGLEQTYQARTTFKCNVFNLWSITDWTQFSSKVAMVYAGNNVFHLVANIGRATETDAVGAMRSMNFYFTASADVPAAAAPIGTLSDLDLSLHLDLTSRTNAAASARIAALLGDVAGPAANPLAQGMRTFAANSKTGAVELHIALSRSAFSTIAADPTGSGKPATASTPNDQKNWDAFCQAANDLQAWPLPNLVSGQNAAYLQTFAAWQALNKTTNNNVNRSNTFYPIDTWPAEFPQLDSGKQALIVYSLTAGQIFMNFCADLQTLAQLTATDAVPPSWADLVKQVTSAIKNDAQIDFAPAATLALLRLCNTGITPTLTGPAPPAVPTDHFPVTLSL